MIQSTEKKIRSLLLLALLAAVSGLSYYTGTVEGARTCFQKSPRQCLASLLDLPMEANARDCFRMNHTMGIYTDIALLKGLRGNRIEHIIGLLELELDGNIVRLDRTLEGGHYEKAIKALRFAGTYRRAYPRPPESLPPDATPQAVEIREAAASILARIDDEAGSSKREDP